MARPGSLWVGVLDLDESEPVAAVNGPLRTDQDNARILVRLHRAPLGYVTVQLSPTKTLSDRARAAAEVTLADELRRHRLVDDGKQAGDVPEAWDAHVTCPRDFTPPDGAGISVIICTRDRPSRLRDCLSSLQKVTYAPLEILVVDNAPTGDGTRKVVAEFAAIDARIRYLCEPRPGLSVARNLGVAKARFDLLAFTDDDTLVDPGWPAALAAGFAADQHAECITGIVVARSLDTGSELYFDSRYTWGKNFEPRRYDLAEHRDGSALYPYSAGIFGTGANFALRRVAIQRMGGFDTLLGAGAQARGGEDLDVFVRVILGGGRLCYLPAALVWHQHRADAEGLATQLYSYGYGLGAYLAKRLIGREMRVAVLGRGLLQSGATVRRMRQASKTSQLPSGRRKLALMEAAGVVAGAVCYYRLTRRMRQR
jgi:glycosyltransferase involved in cell wall biosynthesis